jgi:hypothetical protein
MELYRKRQTIVEHPFGVIKRQWDFYYVMIKKTINRASADVGSLHLRLVFIPILGILLHSIQSTQNLRLLRELGLPFLVLRNHFKAIYGLFSREINTTHFSKTNVETSLKRLYLSKKRFVLDLNLGF